MHFELTGFSYIINPRRKDIPLRETKTPRASDVRQAAQESPQSSSLYHMGRATSSMLGQPGLIPLPGVVLFEQSRAMPERRGLWASFGFFFFFSRLVKHLSPQPGRPPARHTLLTELAGKNRKADRCLSCAPRKQAGERAASCVYGAAGE